MSSRTDKYIDDDTYTNNISRTTRNANLYRQVYSKYEDSDNLPIDDNTKEIDMEKLKELVSSTNDKEEQKNLRESLNILDTRKRKIDEQKLYDINKILEKAKNENSKLKEPTVRESIINKDMLSTLESRELSLEEIRKASAEYEEKVNHYEEMVSQDKENELTMTREFKFKELSNEVEKFNSNPLNSNSSDNDLSFDLFEELKPTGNTIVTKPIIDDDYKPNIHSSDTKDIDIIKSDRENLEEFFTSSYEFSKKDFAKLNEEDDFFETKNNHNGVKIFFLTLAIIIFAIAIFCFIKTYGLGL